MALCRALSTARYIGCQIGCQPNGLAKVGLKAIMRLSLRLLSS